MGVTRPRASLMTLQIQNPPNSSAFPGEAAFERGVAAGGLECWPMPSPSAITEGI